MPSGQTHDRITLWSLPLVTASTLALTGSGNITLGVSVGFLFSGLMLSPDLDLHSLPFKRWGFLRWIWIPYQQVMQHRSIFSHGPIIGTTIRVLYLACWIFGIGVILVAIFQFFREVPGNWRQFTQDMAILLIQYRVECIALLVGLELGAMSHYLSDWTNSAYKRSKKKTKKKPKRTPRKIK